MLPYSISRQMLRTKDLNLKFVTKILNENHQMRINEPCIKSFVFNGRKYVVVKSYSYAILQYMRDSVKIDNTSIYISDKNLYYLVTGLREMRDIMMRDDIYYRDGNNTKMFEDIKDVTVNLIDGKGNTLKLMPSTCVINDISYEAVALYINGMGNEMVLDIESYDALIYNLSKIDFFLYSQSLIQTVIMSSYMDMEKITPKYDVTYKTVINGGQDISPDPPMTSSSTVKTKPKEDIFKQAGLGK